ncbi:MAG: hypothetical protein AAFQ02_01405 [Bacteroidota bacterium]
MRLIILTIVMFMSTQMFAQNVIVISKDTTLSSTWILEEDTVIRSAPGQTITIDCDGDCSPTIVADNCTVQLENVKFTRNARSRFVSVRGHGSEITWNLPGSKGFMRRS